MGSRTLWLWLFVVSLAVTAVLGMMAMLLPSIPYEGEMLATSGLLTGYSLLGLVASLAIARGHLQGLAWSAIAFLAVSLIGWLVLVWWFSPLSSAQETIARAAGSSTILGVLALHVVLLYFARFKRQTGRAVRTGTIGTAAAAAVLAITLIWELDRFLDEELTARAMGSMLIPAALGTIAIPVLLRIEFVTRRESEETTLDRSVLVRVHCPRCGSERECIANRKSPCPGCGLEVTVRLAEPRCQCGYLLYGLPAPVCPECGKAVPEDRWWRTASPSVAEQTRPNAGEAREEPVQG